MSLRSDRSPETGPSGTLLDSSREFQKGLVFVTGGTGFVGSHVVDRLLADGHRVRLLVRERRGRAVPERSGATLVPGDLRDAESLARGLAGAESVCHVAGLVQAARRRDFFDVNAEGTLRLASAAARAGIRRFVLVSSLAAAGPVRGSGTRDESTPEATVSAYGESKARGEERLKSVFPRERTVIVRPPIVYGPRDRGLLPLFRAVARNIMPLLGLGERWYSLIHAEDLARALTLALTVPEASGETLFVTSRDRLEQRDLLTRIAAAVGRRPVPIRIPIPVLALPAAVLSLAGRVAGRPVMLSLAKLPEIAARNWTCSGERAERLLGFKPGVSLDHGLRATVAWYREHGLLPRAAGRADSADVSGARIPL